MTDTTAGAVELPLWAGEAIEPCDTAAADEQAHRDLHAPRRQAIDGDAGRSPSRGRQYEDYVRGVEPITLKGEWL